ncbi:MAG: succinate dehydrogenase, hydrophobic membrane anchor protein [Parvibaculales bacterium]
MDNRQTPPMQTLLARVRGTGAAKKGTSDFWMQRVTALANIPLSLFFVVGIVTHIDATHAQMRAFLGQPLVGVVALLFIISMSWHMRLGLQSVVEDYIHRPALKLAVLIANNFFALALGVSCALAVLKLVIGG